LGHDLGDAVLARAAETVRTVAEAGDEIARIGGDEFVVARFGSQATGARRPDRDTLSALAGGLLQALGAPMELNGHPCRVGASIGIASAAPGEIDPKQLLIDADIALNRAKTDGRNRWEFFTAEMQAERLATKRMADAIFGGLETDAFIPYYQPQFCARSGRVNGVEALARLRMPDGAILPPGAFLSVADNLDATAEIDRMIMRRAAEDWLALRAEGIELGKLSVNVSARRLTDPRLASDVEALGMPTEALSVELLESTFLDDPDDAARWAIDRLQELGVAIEVDDFGAGHASIVSVMRLRPARLKIDRALVAPIDACPQARQLLRSILDIGRALGARVIAEGVETLNHADLLVEMGCDALQGYAFAKPMPQEALARFLREKPWLRTLARHASGS
ncbi:MAG: bifunctional diguanylate cyclase/phosphodiesterase, partial [Pseudomonadota bacterium]